MSKLNIETVQRTMLESLSFDLATYVNSSSNRHFIAPSRNSLCGPFGANVKPVAIIGNERFIASRISVKEYITRNYGSGLSSTNWTSDPALKATITANQEVAPNGLTEMARVTSGPDGTYSQVYRNITVDASVDKYVFGAYIKNIDSQYIRLQLYGGGFPTSNNTFDVNLISKTISTHGTNILDHGIIELSNGTLLVWGVITSNGATSSRFYLSPEIANPQTLKSEYFWRPFIQKGSYPIILATPTTTAAVTVAKDDLRFLSATIPERARLRHGYRFYLDYSSAQLAAGDLRYIEHSNDVTQDIDIYIKGDKKIYVDGASNLLTSGVLSWTERTPLDIIIDPLRGEVTLSGFVSGNGTYSGTPWSVDDGDVFVAQDRLSANQINGIISEPRLWV